MIARLRAAGCVFAEDEARVLRTSAASAEQLESMLRRREAGEPLEYVVGWAQFAGVRVAVEPGVFIPRRRTEALVDQALARARVRASVLDLCCGAGAIAAALLAQRPDLQVWASDVDPAAVSCARRNTPRVVCGDLFAALPAMRFDLIVVNAPYVPSSARATLPRESAYEHPVALDGGADGLDVHRRIAQRVSSWLNAGGTVLCEVAPAQAPALVEAYADFCVEVIIDHGLKVAVLAAT